MIFWEHLHVGNVLRPVGISDLDFQYSALRHVVLKHVLEKQRQFGVALLELLQGSLQLHQFQWIHSRFLSV